MNRLLNLCLGVVLLAGVLLAITTSIIPARATSITSFIVNPFSTVDWFGEPNYEGDNFGTSVASAGDVNGDGYSDIIVGSPYYINGQSLEGRAYVYQGSGSGLDATPAWTFESDIENCQLGWSVASASDVNNDGFDDVLVGALYCTTSPDPNHREGRVYLFLGSSTGLSTTPAWWKEGEGFDESFGWSVASAGDVNSDGYGDVIIGAPWASYPEGHEGRAYVFHGTDSGLEDTAAWVAESDLPWTDFGQWVDSAGDVDDDGFTDVIIGHPGWASPEDAEGRAYVYMGSAVGLETTPAWTYESNIVDCELGTSVSDAGDVNGDGYADVLAGGVKCANPDNYEGVAYLFLGSATGLSLTPIWSQEGNQAFSHYSRSLASAGDVNDDGFGDIIIGAPYYDAGEEDEGLAFLYFGSAGGILPEPFYSKGGDQAGASFSFSVATAGDVNGDGIDDILVGAPAYDGGQDNEGRVTVYYGSIDAAARILLPLVVR
ncbi:MAG: hypothetical protein A2136_02005 [Chloroflexi bacterium RBG_16_54_11]|nr:MAG: hypothetical protein A2136_02005 [Chloroflexi bacterium RBG_16_54_11]